MTNDNYYAERNKLYASLDIAEAAGDNEQILHLKGLLRKLVTEYARNEVTKENNE